MQNKDMALRDFSVLMSVYKNDKPDFFELALRSITTDQKLKPKQVVIIQDGPVAQGIDHIIENISNEESSIKFTVEKNAENKGLAVSLNKGLKLCDYEWIARMDADDISVPERFSIQRRFILKHTELDLVGAYIAEFENAPNDIHSLREVPVHPREIKQMLKTRNPINHVTVMYKKSSVLAAGGYSENFGKLEDYKLWVDMISCGYRMVNIPKVLVNVRIGNGFIERRSNKREIQDWDMLQEYLLRNNFIKLSKALRNKLYIRCFTYMPPKLKEMAYKYVLRRK